IPLVGYWQRNAIYDAVRLYGYNAPSTVANLATRGTMTDYGRHMFYVNRPQLITDSDTFRKDCTVAEQTIVLGCYHPTQQGIYVYSVSDARLAGIVEVTSAHEMLHAAYDRLSKRDKSSVDKMLDDYYKKDLHDQRILDTIEAYKKSEPNDIINEMHSIFGTEIANLPSQLEDYYKRYFTNRQAVVAFSQNYENEFTSRSAKAAQYEKQLNDLKTKINTEENNLKAQLAGINAEQARLDSLKANNKIEEYNAGVPAYNASIDAYNSGVAQYKRDINNYNSLVEQYNAVAGELKQLYGAIDTRLSPK
ncbi:hypothetical protein HYS42_01045, partial [Candidatus Saccharibacteria bacterium]|nr:hypothetical protein [Candidatus Saccharibacteria bacterium]